MFIPRTEKSVSVFLLFHCMQDIIKSRALEREREREREHPISNGLSFFFFHKTRFS